MLVWCYLRRAPGDIRQYAYTAFDRFFRDDEPLKQQVEGVFADFAMLYIASEDRSATKVRHIEFNRYKVRADLVIDSEHRDEYFHVFDPFRGIDFRTPEQIAAEAQAKRGIIEAEHRFNERKLEALYRWKPSAGEWAVLVGMVNKRARRVLLNP